MGIALIAHYYDRTEGLIATSALDAAGVVTFAMSSEIVGVQPFHEIAYGGYRIYACDEDVAAAVTVLTEARAKPLFGDERLSTHHLLIPSLLITCLFGAPMPLRRHRWHDVTADPRL